jgi:hypothetical protein
MKKALELMAVALTAALFSGAASAATGGAPSAPSLYIGYYQEDPIDNPEDPTMGTLYLTLPSSDGRFAGSMYFTYVGCQTSNVGRIAGDKTAAHLEGTWSGTLDGTAQNGTFAGNRTPPQDIYRGKFAVAGGKQHITVGSCIQYYIASKGSFELFPVGSSDPASFSISFRDDSISWSPPSGAAMILISVVDPALAVDGQRNATLWQTLVPGTQARVDVSHIGLIQGRQYLAIVGTADSRFIRMSFGSTPFIAP